MHNIEAQVEYECLGSLNAGLWATVQKTESDISWSLSSMIKVWLLKFENMKDVRA